MKILTLRLKNLNSLKGEWSVDFTKPPFVDNGLFAITGPTGAGKSTLLVMSLALYPYVFLLARDAFATQGRRALEAAQSLGAEPVAGVLAGGLAHGTALADGRRVAGADGGAGRLWRGVDFQL